MEITGFAVNNYCRRLCISRQRVQWLLLMVPVTISVCKLLNINPISLILAQIFASNIGGATTLIGDPPNIMIGSAAGIDFMSFAYHMTPEDYYQLWLLQLYSSNSCLEKILSKNQKILKSFRSVRREKGNQRSYAARKKQL